MNIIEELSCDGVPPMGPVSAWPQERHDAMIKESAKSADSSKKEVVHAKKVKAGAGRMAKGFVKTARQAILKGKVSEEVREERYDTCKACPFFVEKSKRCSDCGCFMEAKTWVGGDPKILCPQKKWSR